FVGWFWFIGVLVPFIGLIQVGAQAMADRFAYIPILGLLIIAVWGAADLSGRLPLWRGVLTAAGFFALTACCVVTHFQLKHWKNGIALFSHAIDVTDKNALAECNLGNALGADGHPQQAIEHLQKALLLSPGYAEAQVNLGVALVTVGKLDEAVQ